MPADDTFLIIAVDGGAASGKSSTSRAIGRRFQLLHVDTGSFYRAITHRLLQDVVKPDEAGAVEAALSAIHLDTRVHGNTAIMVIDGSVPGEEIRNPEVNAAVSAFSALPSVRTFLLDYQRGQVAVAQRAGFRGLIMEGRDIGSVIFPKATFRFFLQADPEARVRRRAEQGQADSIHQRDRMDSQRKTAPLLCPPGAILIDSTHLTLDEVIEKMAGLIEGGKGISPAHRPDGRV